MYSFTRSSLTAGLALVTLSFSIMGSAQTLQESTGVVAGPFVSNGSLNTAANGVFTYSAVGGYIPGDIKFSGSFTAISPSFRSHAGLYLTAPNGASFNTSFPGFPASAGSSAVTDFAISASNFAGLTASNNTGNWTARFFEFFDDGSVGTVDGNWTNIKFDFFNTPPPTTTDLGTIDYNSITFGNTAISAGQVNWFKFDLASAASADRFLDISTVNVGGEIVDTEIALYDAAGTRLAFDDDDGPDSYSDMSFGSDTAYAGRVANGNFGRDGAALAAGTYYLGVGQFNTTFNENNWNVSSTGAGAGNIRVRLHAAPAPSSMVVMVLGGLMPLMAIARQRRSAK